MDWQENCTHPPFSCKPFVWLSRLQLQLRNCKSGSPTDKTLLLLKFETQPEYAAAAPPGGHPKLLDNDGHRFVSSSPPLNKNRTSTRRSWSWEKRNVELRMSSALSKATAAVWLDMRGLILIFVEHAFAKSIRKFVCSGYSDSFLPFC